MLSKCDVCRALLDEEDLFRIAVVCNKFFWIGWNARGATEDASKLEGLTGGENDGR